MCYIPKTVTAVIVVTTYPEPPFVPDTVVKPLCMLIVCILATGHKRSIISIIPILQMKVVTGRH